MNLRPAPPELAVKWVSTLTASPTLPCFKSAPPQANRRTLYCHWAQRACRCTYSCEVLSCQQLLKPAYRVHSACFCSLLPPRLVLRDAGFLAVATNTSPRFYSLRYQLPPLPPWCPALFSEPLASRQSSSSPALISTLSAAACHRRHFGAAPWRHALHLP